MNYRLITEAWTRKSLVFPWGAVHLCIVISLLAGACSLEERGKSEGRLSDLEKTSSARTRQPVDQVGYTHTAEGITAVVDHALQREAKGLEENRARLGLDEGASFVGAISPHDDYLYAQQVYVHLYPHIKARHVILLGVAHKAREFPDCEGKLVFDNFDAWHGPYQPVPISPLRQALIQSLPAEDLYVSDALHNREHSLEGLVPFLQHFNRDVSIVPILVPYMTRPRLEELAHKTALSLGRIMKERGLTLGEDVALLISSDSVHYGDRDWGGRSYADFGTTGAGYDQAVARDLGLVRDYLTGRVSLSKAGGFYDAVVAEDCHEYRITWCGRFSIPFGLCTLAELSAALDQEAPHGSLLRYGTTLDPGRSDPGVANLDVTAGANLHHWVGFVSVAYRQP